MTNFLGYIYLLLAVILGITSNGFLKTTNGFTNLVPTTMCVVTIVLCIFFLAKAMMTIPVGFTYATYGSLTTIGALMIGMIKFNQIPNLYSIIGVIFILIGVVLVNYFGNIS